MRVVVQPLPVLYACQGCEAFGQRARDLGGLFERAGALEMVWLGAPGVPAPRQRYPAFALDGCAWSCARRWLERQGIAVDESFVLAGRDGAS